MSENSFKVGDVVVLKSGGAPMTIESISEATDESPPHVKCCWSETKEILQHASFSPDMLTLEGDKPIPLAELLGDPKYETET